MNTKIFGCVFRAAIRGVAVFVLFLAVCALYAYSQQEELAQKLSVLARKIDENNQANIEALERAGNAGHSPAEEEYRSLRARMEALTIETMELQKEIRQAGVRIYDLPGGAEVLSDLRLKTLSKIALFRRLWKSLYASGGVSDTEEELAQKWSMMEFRIGDEQALHDDTQKQLKERVKGIRACGERIAAVAQSIVTPAQAASAVLALRQLFYAMEMECLTVSEYVNDDPAGAESMVDVLNETMDDVWNAKILPAAQGLEAADYYGNDDLRRLIRGFFRQ